MRRVDVARCGVVARKLGMTRVFDESGRLRAATALKVDASVVVGHVGNGDYRAIRVGHGKSKARNRAEAGVFKNGRAPVRRNVTEFRVGADAVLPEIGLPLRADHFQVGQLVDVTGNSKGCGFTGPMKRHGFRGLRATHGVSVSHRSHGSTGHCQDPGRIFKNKKMAGHHGDKRVTTLSLEVLSVDPDDDVILVSGAVPGSRRGRVILRDALRGDKRDDSQPYKVATDDDRAEKPEAAEAAAADDSNEARGNDG